MYMCQKVNAQEFYFPDIEDMAPHSVEGIKVILPEPRNFATTGRQKKILQV